METTPKANPLGVDMGSVEEAVARIRGLNEKIIENSKSVGGVALQSYEKALESLLSLEEKAAGATQLEWVSAIAQTHASMVRDLSAAYTKAARELVTGAPTT